MPSAPSISCVPNPMRAMTTSLVTGCRLNRSTSSSCAHFAKNERLAAQLVGDAVRRAEDRVDDRGVDAEVLVEPRPGDDDRADRPGPVAQRRGDRADAGLVLAARPRDARARADLDDRGGE